MTQETPEREPEEYRFRWTEHPDAFPGLTHCPSCGETVDVPWGTEPGDHRPAHPVRCEQCDRDLRLPRYAVKDQLCLVCKVPAAEAGEGVAYRRLETGERMCSNCTADLRAFKYEVEVQTFVADWITDEHRRDLNRALLEVADAHEKDYTFTAEANARYGRMEPLPEEAEGVTLEALIAGDVDEEDLPDEMLQELEDAVDQAGPDGGEAGGGAVQGGEPDGGETDL